MMRISIVLTLAMLAGSMAPGAAQETAPNRSGFTLLLNLGVGFQHDQFIGSTESGLGGINLGLGGFVSDDTALLFRVSGTNVSYDGVWQTSGMGGAAVQYWVDDKLHLEGGAGVGFWDVEGVNESGLGLMLGAGYSIWNNAGHNLYIGVEYAPAFTDPDTVHNVGIVFGWQLL
jgi:hypothetical protein